MNLDENRGISHFLMIGNKLRMSHCWADIESKVQAKKNKHGLGFLLLKRKPWTKGETYRLCTDCNRMIVLFFTISLGVVSTICFAFLYCTVMIVRSQIVNNVCVSVWSEISVCFQKDRIVFLLSSREREREIITQTNRYRINRYQMAGKSRTVVAIQWS